MHNNQNTITVKICCVFQKMNNSFNNMVKCYVAVFYSEDMPEFKINYFYYSIIF